MSLLLDTALKVSVVVGVGLAASLWLRNRSAALRHWILAAALLCAAVIPALSLVTPSWSLPVASLTVDETTSSFHATRSDNTPAGSQAESPLKPIGLPLPLPATNYRLPADAILVVWLTGVAVNVAILIAGMLQLLRFASRATEVRSGPWVEVTRDISTLHRHDRPVRLLQSDHPSLLVTWGLFTSKIMLPAGAGYWATDRIRIVVSHEIAHIQRRDWLIQTGAELLRSLYWFNPLVWIACSRLRQESERASDDAVVRLGVEGKEYATHLLELARVFGAQRRLWFAAPAIAPRRSGLERRISAMLKSDLNRRPVTPHARALIVMALVAVTLPIAGFAQNTFATLSGSIVDQLDGVLPAVSVVVTDTQRQVTHEARTDRTGRFEFVGLPQGDYLLEASIPGFKTSQTRLTLAGQDVQRDLRLQIGSLQEMITVTDGPDRSLPVPDRAPRAAKPDCPAPNQPLLVAGGIGGNIRQPRKLRHVAPIYPGGDVQGVVVLETLIGTDGFIKDVRVASSPNLVLTEAAVDAVRQWHFEQTLLNCVPVETEMTVTVDFQRQ